MFHKKKATKHQKKKEEGGTTGLDPPRTHTNMFFRKIIKKNKELFFQVILRRSPQNSHVRFVQRIEVALFCGHEHRVFLFVFASSPPSPFPQRCHLGILHYAFSSSKWTQSDSGSNMNSIQHIDELVKEYLLVNEQSNCRACRVTQHIICMSEWTWRLSELFPPPNDINSQHSFAALQIPTKRSRRRVKRTRIKDSR